MLTPITERHGEPQDAGGVVDADVDRDGFIRSQYARPMAEEAASPVEVMPPLKCWTRCGIAELLVERTAGRCPSGAPQSPRSIRRYGVGASPVRAAGPTSTTPLPIQGGGGDPGALPSVAMIEGQATCLEIAVQQCERDRHDLCCGGPLRPPGARTAVSRGGARLTGASQMGRVRRSRRLQGQRPTVRVGNWIYVSPARRHLR